MKTYKVFENSQTKVEVVKEGWSWPACCFGLIWALFKQGFSFKTKVNVSNRKMALKQDSHQQSQPTSA